MSISWKMNVKKKSLTLASLLLLGLSACVDPVDEVHICCQLSNGSTSTETLADCQHVGGIQISDDMCAIDDHDVCCDTATGIQTLPASECPNAQVLAADQCLEEDVCCKTATGNQTVPASECLDDQILDADQCLEEDVCCKTATGNQTVPVNECPDNQVLDAEQCLEEDVCCRIDGVFVTVPADQCPDGQLAPSADSCIDADVCCSTATGHITMPDNDCPDGQDVSADMCLEVCCDLDTGLQLLPAGDCTANQTVSNDICAMEICCKTIDGFETLPQSSCPQTDIVADELCLAEVCCKTASGNMFVPPSECDPAGVIDDELCITPDTECLKFRAVDMGALPYTTTSGDTLQSITSTYGTFPAQSSWSSSCLDQPATGERAFAGVGNDLTLNFAAAVSSIFILRYHAQPGDDLIIPGTSLSSTFCGASSYHNITKVDLTASGAAVTIQDTNPGGGSGYSVLLAECIEWAQH